MVCKDAYMEENKPQPDLQWTMWTAAHNLEEIACRTLAEVRDYRKADMCDLDAAARFIAYMQGLANCYIDSITEINAAILKCKEKNVGEIVGVSFLQVQA